MKRLRLRFAEFCFSIWVRQKISKHEFIKINSGQAKSGLLMSHKLTIDKIRERIYWRHLTSIRNNATVKFLFWSCFIIFSWSVIKRLRQARLQVTTSDYEPDYEWLKVTTKDYEWLRPRLRETHGVYKIFFSKSRTMQDSKGHFGGFCKTILTLNEGQCRTIWKKITKNTGEYRVSGEWNYLKRISQISTFKSQPMKNLYERVVCFKDIKKLNICFD